MRKDKCSQGRRRGIRFADFDVEHNTWDEITPYSTFAYKTAIREIAEMTPFELVCCRKPTPMLDAMLAHVEDVNLNADVQGYAEWVKEPRLIARERTTD